MGAVPLTAFSTRTCLYEWPVEPQSNKVINDVGKDLEHVAPYLDHVNVFNSDPSACINTRRVYFACESIIPSSAPRRLG